MSYQKLIQNIGFQPKENATDIFIKKYTDGYCIEVDFLKKTIDYGSKITYDNKSTQNHSQPENFVVLECVNRLLERGYSPSAIKLENTWKLGHQDKGRLDILVKNTDGTVFLMIECKTFGKEYEKELNNINKNGGQLFSYFQQDRSASILMLYASELRDEEIEYNDTIIIVNDICRKTDSVKDFYTAWDKKTYQNIVWENLPYNSEIKKSFTKLDLKPLSKDQSDKIFHGFASILRKHSVSDKPNAFNKIFNLFLAKLYDEDKGDKMELEFHWREDDNPIDFQVRLINLHKKGLEAFLAKEIAGIEDSDFEGYKSTEELLERKKKILMFNNVFAIKEVDDDETFNNNQRVLKEVVQLLEKYQIRYPRKQQHLSDFFELLLTTGLKQEVGQYFTPPPVTKFIVRSLPIKKMMLQEINSETPKLPAVIDYAAGSGHFITEALEEYQDIINNIDIDKELNFPKAKSVVQSWVADPYNWAAKYVYGIEKDYRLVKVAKVGCYFYGDGVAQIIHGDGLDSFATSKTYKGLLKENINIEDSSKAKFSVVISNPPYAVNDCKDDLEYIGAQEEYTLYNSLSDKSKDIECLFVERTKHLLKDGGVASLILPSSILNNTGIQTKTREIILQYFDIVAIAELGSNTFMATGTNTVTLFLRRRANKLSVEWKKSVAHFFENLQDITINGTEKPVAKYVKHVFENVSFADYISLLEKTPNETIQNHEIYKEYRKKLKAKNEKDFWSLVFEREADKILYFVIALNQKVVLVKSGEKEIEKRFLGYYFSQTRGNEGMHAMQREKTVDECTQMYDAKQFDNPEKASTYILKAFNNLDFIIDPKMQNHISQHNLVDLMNFDRVEFEKNISLSIKKKVTIDSKWNLTSIGNVLFEQPKSKIQVGTAKSIENGIYNFYTSGEKVFTFDEFLVDGENIYLSTGGNAVVKFYDGKAAYSTDTFVVKSKDENKIKTKVIFYFLENIISIINEFYFKGLGLRHLQKPDFRNIQFPLPPLDIQQKIVSEIEVLEAKEKKAKESVKELKSDINIFIKDFCNGKFPTQKLGNLCNLITKGSSPTWQGIDYIENPEVLFITSENVREGFIDLTKRKYLQHQFNEIQPRSILQKGDVLINIVGASIGRAAIFLLEDLANINQAVCLVRCNFEVLDSTFLNLFLNSKDALEMYDSMKIDVARANLSLQNISDLKIPLPPLSEQQKIVAEIEKIEAKITVLEIEIAQIPKDKEAILKKYL